MSPVVTATWAGSPSRMATRAGPWDSPAVSQRSMQSVFHGPFPPRPTVRAPERTPDRTRREAAPAAQVERPDAGAPQHADQRPEQHERPERVGPPVDEAQRGQQRTTQPAEQEPGVDADEQRP